MDAAVCSALDSIVDYCGLAECADFIRHGAYFRSA